MKKRKKGIIFLSMIVIVCIFFWLFKTLYLGYHKVSMIYEQENGSQTIELGIPRLSFMAKENDKSYSYKNLRGQKVLEKEIKDYLNTLEKRNCNNTKYYYDKENDFTIIDYSVENHFFYHTISYDVRYKDYCFQNKINEYAKKLGGIKRFHAMSDRISLSENQEFTPRLSITFLDDIDGKNQTFTASMNVEYLSPIPNVWDRISRKEIENSKGTYEIKDNLLYYYRTEVSSKAEDITIPEVSTFRIEDGTLILMDSYLSNYEETIVLK